MSRLIDADELFNWGDKKLKDAVKYGNKSSEQQEWSYSTLMMYEVADEIFDAPTIDAVPVVRCKDCKYAFFYPMNTMYECGQLEDRLMFPDDFCSYGVKMDEGEAK